MESGQREPMTIELYGSLEFIDGLDEVVALRDALTDTIAAFGMSE